MDDFDDGIIDKLIALLEQDPEARPISDDLPALVRTLAATTTMTIAEDSAFVGRGNDARAPDAGESGKGAAVHRRSRSCNKGLLPAGKDPRASLPL